MGQISYAAAAVAVRPDLVAAQERAWHGLAGAGDWWTGAERVAIAGEVRAAWGCALCRERKAALSPAAVAGAHEAMPALPAVAIDAIHRITTDPGRLTRAWFDGLLAGGLSDAAYVTQLYANVLERSASPDEVAYHVNRLNSGATRGDVAAGFTEALEYQLETVSLVDDGIAVADAGFVLT